jgi:hypothetical protein
MRLKLVQEKSKTSVANPPFFEGADIESNQTFVEFSQGLADRENVVLALKMRLASLDNIDSAWYEEKGNGIYIYIDALETGKATLRSIFDIQYEIEEDFPHLAFHFRVDSQELENRKTADHLTRLI